MALDGALLSQVKHEIACLAAGARIDRIAQPGREEIILHLRWRGGAGKLLLSANANSPRVHFTESAPENPKTPPMFCMLLRKHLSGAKLLGLRQMGMDRILFFDFEAQNELGDLVKISIVCEIMGRHSNIIVVTQEGKILDSIKRVDYETSRVRQVLPGITYCLPPMQDKLPLTDSDVSLVIEKLKGGRDIELSKALMETLQGMSPLPCRELAHYAARGLERSISQLDDDGLARLRFRLEQTAAMLREHTCIPVMVLDLDERPRDFSFLPVHQYGAAMLTREYESFSELLDAFYARRDLIERQKQRSSDLLRLLANTSDRIARKLAAQREELLECGQRGQLRIMGDLLTANLHLLKKGDSKAVLVNYYDPDGAELEITLDIRLTPVQNAQRYFALYRKADTAEKMLHTLIAQGEEELVYIDSVFDALTRAETSADLDAIRTELAQGGYARPLAQKRDSRPKKEEKLPPLRFRSGDGFLIQTGRNNIQNDRLTLRESRGNDIWLHTQKIPGSHTIILSEGKDVPKSTIEQACVIAAFHSRARDSSKVPVDFTQIRNVKKPSGAKPGMVIYDHYETVIVDPDEELVNRLAIR